ncbi:MAG: hypothetical protein COA47_06350 [Robiginitomaculum sp.]|nr:MAG: hypothetical protein COA47_06350 [Robiginitomaculum sp.]
MTKDEGKAMKSGMTMERFKELAAAYGADVEQWPVQYQNSAIALAEIYPDETMEVLKSEVKLDSNLATLPRQQSGTELRKNILRSFVSKVPTDTFSFTGLFAMIFGQGKHAMGFAFASILLLVASGVVGGYLGGDIMINTQDTAYWDVQVFSDRSFVLEPGVGT